MSMKMTWFDIFFSSKHGIGFRSLEVYQYCPFSCVTENKALAAILVLSILMNRSYFQINALKPGIYSHRISRGVFELLYNIFFI